MQIDTQLLIGLVVGFIVGGVTVACHIGIGLYFKGRLAQGKGQPDSAPTAEASKPS